MASKVSKNIVPLIVACALFMENLDGSVIATALPAIARSLHADPIHLNLAITSYMFSLAAFIPLSGWTADRFGARAVFRAAILVFTVSSAGCGLSQTLPELVIFRMLQGVGGAMMVPVGRLVLLRTIPKAELVGAMAWVTIPALVGPVMGPPVGGFIVTYSSWHWIFFLNLPIGLVGIVLSTIFIGNIREENPGPLDIKGFILMSVALAGLICGLESAGRNMLPPAVVILLLAGGLAFLGIYVRYAYRSEHPIVDIRLFKIPTFMAATVGGFVYRTGIGALPFLLPMMLQFGFGLSALSSGLLTFASAVGAILMKMTAARIIRRFGYRRVLLVNTFIASGSMLGVAFFRPATPHMFILLFLLMGGFFRSLQFTSMNTLAYSDITLPCMSRATTLVSMLQQLSQSFGVAIGALLLNCVLRWHGNTQLGPDDFWPPLVCASLLACLSVLVFTRLKPDAGAEVSGYVSPETEVKETEP